MAANTRRYSAFESALDELDPDRMTSISTAATNSSGATAPPPIEDDELPGYNTLADDGLGTVPSYDEDRMRTPTFIFDLVCLSSKVQRFVNRGDPSGAAIEQSSTAYIIVQRSKLFSKRADISMYAHEGSTLRPDFLSRAVKQCERLVQPDITITIDSGTTLPWMPRATLRFPKQLISAADSLGTVSMAAPNQRDWQLKIGSRVLIWALSARPVSLMLIDKDREEIIARFIHSAVGIDARKGQEIGRLEIYSDHTTDDGVGHVQPATATETERMQRTVRSVLASCAAVIRHWKDMGRHHRNSPATPNTGSMGPWCQVEMREGGLGGGLRGGSLPLGTRTHTEIARRNSVVI